jgi:actin-related protein 2
MEKPLVKYKYNSGNVELKDIMIGHEAAQYRSFLELSHPVSEGNI